MSNRVRDHIRSNVVGYIALFVALSGTAWAGATIGSGDVIDNSLRSVDIRDDTSPNGGLAAVDLAASSVHSAELATDSVNTTEIVPDSIRQGDISTGGVGPSEILNGAVTTTEIPDNHLDEIDIAPGGVGSSEVVDNSLVQGDIATSGVGGLEIAANSVDSDEIPNFALVNEDIGVLYAVVSANGTVVSSSSPGNVTVQKNATSAIYGVDFNHPLGNCAATATPFGVPFFQVSSETEGEVATVSIADDDGTYEDQAAFSVIVVC
jgi:hypothetical protein